MLDVKVPDEFQAWFLALDAAGADAVATRIWCALSRPDVFACRADSDAPPAARMRTIKFELGNTLSPTARRRASGAVRHTVADAAQTLGTSLSKHEYTVTVHSCLKASGNASDPRLGHSTRPPERVRAEVEPLAWTEIPSWRSPSIAGVDRDRWSVPDSSCRLSERLSLRTGVVKTGCPGRRHT
jgi:hypothetical protein